MCGYKFSDEHLRPEQVASRKASDMASTSITSDIFDAAVAGSTPVLVDFWASWCGPCRALGPAIEEISDEKADRLTVYKCNVDDQAELAERFRIVSIPTLILFKDGKPVHTMVGSMPKAALLAEIEPYL